MLVNSRLFAAQIQKQITLPTRQVSVGATQSRLTISSAIMESEFESLRIKHKTPTIQDLTLRRNNILRAILSDSSFTKKIRILSEIFGSNLLQIAISWS